MEEETKKEDLPKENVEEEEIKKSEEKEEETSELSDIMNVIDVFLQKSAVYTVDLNKKLEVYLKIFGTAMKTLKEKEPKVWAELLASTKMAYQQSPDAANVAIEMLAANIIEYEEYLLEGKVSPFSNQLYQYAKINNLLFR